MSKLCPTSILFCAIALGLTGCGGSGATGHPTPLPNPLVKIAWPAPSNAFKSPKSAIIVFPGAAAGGGDVTFTVNRSGSGAMTQGYRCPVVISFGLHTMLVKFESGSNGTGTEVATASGTVTATSAGTLMGNQGGAMEPIAFGTGVNSISVINGQTANVGQAYPIQFSALDVNGNIVAVQDGAVSFQIVQGGDATVNAAGNLVAGLAGTVTVQASIGNITSSATAISVQAVSAALRQLLQNTNSMVISPQSGLIWASVPSIGGTYGNQVVEINPATGAVVGGIFAGSEPGPLALSSDGSTLFVGLSGADAIQQILTAGPSLGTQFALAAPQFSNVNAPAGQIVVQPGSTSNIAVSRVSNFNSGAEFYLSGAVAPNTLSNSTAYALAFVSPSELFAATNYSGLLDVSADSKGLTQLSSLNLLNSTNTVSLTYDSGRVYVSDGSVLDAVAKTRIGSFDLSIVSNQSSSAISFVVDGVNHRVFFLTVNYYSGPYILSAFDTRTFLPVGSVNIPAVFGTSLNSVPDPNLVRFGAKGLAFRTATSIYFLDHAPGL